MNDTTERRHPPNNEGWNQLRGQRPTGVANAFQFERSTNDEPDPYWSAQHGGPSGLLLAGSGKSSVEDIGRDDEEDPAYFQLCVDIRIELRKHTDHGVNDGENDQPDFDVANFLQLVLLQVSCVGALSSVFQFKNPETATAMMVRKKRPANRGPGPSVP